MQVQVEENVFDLLEVLGVIAENLRLLVLGPLVAGLIGLGVSYALPKSFTSRAIMSLPATPQSGNSQWGWLPPTPMQAANIMLTPVVLDPVVAARNFGVDKPLQVARAELGSRTKATVGKDLLLQLEVTAGTPEEAQATANAIIDAWLKSTRPQPRDVEGLTRRLNYSKAFFESVKLRLARLALREGSGRSAGIREDLSSTMIALSELEARYSLEILNLQKVIDGLSRDVLVQEPTLPTEPSAPNKKLIAIVSALLVAFLLLLWVFIRHVWVTSAKNPLVAKRQEKLRHALNFWS